jgi:hypothetical protein
LGAKLSDIANSHDGDVVVHVVNGIDLWGSTALTVNNTGGYTCTFVRYGDYTGPLFKITSTNGLSRSVGGGLTLTNVVVDGWTSSGGATSPLIYSAEFGGNAGKVSLTGVTLKNNANAVVTGGDGTCAYGSAISLGGDGPDLYASTGDNSLSVGCADGSPKTLTMSGCTVENCGGVEGVVFLDATTLNKDGIEADSGGYKGSVMVTITDTSISYTSTEKYAVCVNWGIEGASHSSTDINVPDYYVHYHTTAASDETPVAYVTFLTDGTNEFVDVDGAAVTSDTAGLDDDYTVILRQVDGHAYVEYLDVTVNGVSYKVYTDGRSADGSIPYVTVGDDGTHTLVIPKDLLPQYGVVTVGAYKWHSMLTNVNLAVSGLGEGEEVADFEVRAVKVTEDSKGNMFGTYLVEFPSDYVPDAVYGWVGGTSSKDVDPSSLDSEEYCLLYLATDSDSVESLNDFKIEGPTLGGGSYTLVFTVTGTALDTFKESNVVNVYIAAHKSSGDAADDDSGDEGSTAAADSAKASAPRRAPSLKATADDDAESGVVTVQCGVGADEADEASDESGPEGSEAVDVAETADDAEETFGNEQAETPETADGTDEMPADGQVEAPETPATAASAEARVLLAQADGSAGTVSASWSWLSVSDDGLVSGSLLVEVDGGAVPTAAWAAVLPAGWSGTDADAWSAAADGGALVYSSDPCAALSQGTGISFAWRPDASAGVLTLEGVPSSGLVDGDGVLRVALCLAGDSLADASPSAVAQALACGSAACAAWSGAVQAGWSNASLDVTARISERAAALAEAARAAAEAAEAERLAAEQAAEVAAAQAAAEEAEQVEAAQETAAVQATTVDAPEPEVEAVPEGVVIQIDATTGEEPTDDGRADAAPEGEPTAETATEAGDASGNDVGEPGDSDAPSPGDGTSQ